VPSGFLFCGACGTRIAPFAARPAGTGAIGSARTIAISGAPAPGPQLRGRLVLIRSDGSEGGTFPLQEGTNVIGRGTGQLFDADVFLSPRHAEIVINGGGVVARDLDSLNGVFVKITEQEEIHSGAIFRIGQELLRFDAIPPPQPIEDGTEIIGSPNPGF